MARQKQRSVFWVVSTHVLTTGFAMPLIAGLAGGAVIVAMQPPPLVALLVLLAIQAVGYVGGVYYSLSYIRKAALISNPVACIKPSIIAFSVLAILGLAANLYAVFAGGSGDINPVVSVLALVVFYAVIIGAFARITRDGFSRMDAKAG